MTLGRGDEGARMKLRLGHVALALCALAAVLWLAPVATADAAISGRVTDTSVQPLEGIQVCALTTGPFGSETCARTDADGKYSISEAGAGYLVHFYSRENAPPGYAPQWYPGKPFFEEAEGVAGADVSHVDAVMSPGGTVRGRVFDVSSESPIEGVEVCPMPTVFREREVSWCADTDANGEYALRGLSAADYRFEFNALGNVNYVEKTAGPFPIGAGGELSLDAGLVPGVGVEGTLTEAGTGLPVEGLTFPPYSAPLVCALDYATEARIKCTWIKIGGHYTLLGLPPGELFGISFAVDTVEDGYDTAPDGYVRQYWQGVPAWNEATMMFGSGGVTRSGIDAVLSRGAEVFPHCEVRSACPPPPDGGGELPLPSVTQPHGTLPLFRRPGIRCKKGFRRVKRGTQRRCVKKKHRGHHKLHSRHR